MSEWREVVLDDLISLQRGYDLATPRRKPGGVPVIGAGGISGWHDTAMAKGPGVVVGRAGASMGHATYSADDFWPLNTSLFVTDFRGNNPRFIYYLLSGIDFSGFNSGAAQPMLNRNYIKHIPLNVPPLTEQKAIVKTLGTLDDKITVNHRIAVTGRALGQAKFADALDRPGGQVVEISELVSELTRGVAPKYSEAPDELTVINQKCIRNGRVDLGPARKTLRAKVGNVKLLRQGDLLVNSTGVGTLGRVAAWSQNMEATVDSHVTIVRFDPEKVDPVCAGYAMLAAQPDIEALGEGSTGQTELSRKRLGSFQIALPSKAAMLHLRQELDPLEARCDAALTESVTLAKLRDTLLPKLMSGEIRVRDAEKAVEDAV